MSHCSWSFETQQMQNSIKDYEFSYREWSSAALRDAVAVVFLQQSNMSSEPSMCHCTHSRLPSLIKFSFFSCITLFSLLSSFFFFFYKNLFLSVLSPASPFPNPLTFLCAFLCPSRPGVLKDLKTMGSISLFIFFITLLVLARQVSRHQNRLKDVICHCLSFYCW